jgi:hypothetical protein
MTQRRCTIVAHLLLIFVLLFFLGLAFFAFLGLLASLAKVLMPEHVVLHTFDKLRKFDEPTLIWGRHVWRFLSWNPSKTALQRRRVTFLGIR